MERIIGRAFAFLVGASCASVALAVACGGIVDDEQTPASFADASGTPAIDARADVDGGATVDADASTPKDPCVGPPGTLDTTFGDGGVVVVPGIASATRVVALLDGSIVIGPAAAVAPATNGAVVLVRLRPDGTLDGSFGKGGIADFGDGAGPRPAVAAQPDGKVLVARTVGPVPPGVTLWSVMRRLPDGSADPSFHGGEVEFGFGAINGTQGSTGNTPTSIAVQPDGRILVSGTTAAWTFPVMTAHAVARFETDGGFDSTFADRGRLLILGANEPGVLALATDGSFVVAGSRATDDAGTPAKLRYDLAAAHVLPDGSFDTSFGDAGQVVVEHESSSSARAVAFDPNGNIILAGYLGANLAVFRLTPKGTLDPTFGDAGVVTAGVDEARGVFAEADGKVIVVGSMTIARFTSNGAPDPTFGTGGFPTNTNGGIEGATVNGCHIVTVGSQGGSVIVARWRR